MFYVVLLALRFCLVLLPGYIHPDEFFQSPEITAGDVFNIYHVRPWEFDSSNPCRTIVVPYLNSGLSFGMLNIVDKVLEPLQMVNSYTLLVAPRLLAAASSLVFGKVDNMMYRRPPPWPLILISCTILHICFVRLMSVLLCTPVVSAATLPRVVEHVCVVRLCKSSGFAATGPLLVFASSWPLVLLTRAFSNTAEALLVSCALMVVLTGKQSNFVRAAAFGGLVAWGLFTRFTYLFFAFPLGLYLVHRMCYKGGRWEIVFPDSMLLGLLGMGASFLLAAVPLVVLDSAYFADCRRGESLVRCVLENFKITPWNSFLYNLDPNNLAEHGLHPRVLHALVNMPILFGPLYLAYVWEVLGCCMRWMRCWSLLWSIGKPADPLRPNRCLKAAPSNRKQPRQRFAKRTRQGSVRRNPPDTAIRWVLLGVVTSGLLLISAAPHQEPRFLLPLLVPLAVLYGCSIASKPKVLACWMIFNGALFVFFGVLHQGGVVPSLHYLNWQMRASNRSSSSILQVVYYKTFMPPLHLLAESQQRNSSFLDVRNSLSLHEELTAMLKRNEMNRLSKNGQDTHGRVYLVCPGYLEGEDCRRYADMALHSHLLWPHVDTDHLFEQAGVGRFDLGVYRLA